MSVPNDMLWLILRNQYGNRGGPEDPKGMWVVIVVGVVALLLMALMVGVGVWICWNG